VLQPAVSTRSSLPLGFREYQYQYQTPPRDVETGLLGPFLIAPPINGAPHGSKTTSRLDDKADAAQTQTRVRNMFLLGLMPTLYEIA
jgi:hypothetical protein